MTIFRLYLPLCLSLQLLATFLYGQDVQFDILKGRDVIGSIQAKRSIKGARTLYSMISNSSFNTIWNNTIRSTTRTEYRNNEMYDCEAYMHLNDNMRDSSHMQRIGEQIHCFVFPDKRFLHSGTVMWTTARMYYEEPMNEQRIFVESEMAFCNLVRTGEGQYKLLLSNGNVNRYVYKNGVLHEIHIDRTLVDLVFRRV